MYSQGKKNRTEKINCRGVASLEAEIIAVGTELLLGETINTNAQYIAKELANLGIDTYYQSVVGDNAERLYEAYRIAFDRVDLVITKGEILTIYLYV